MLIKFLKHFFISVLLLLIFFSNANAKNNSIKIIRDTEIENFLSEISKPIFKVSGIEKLQFYIIQDNSINAFIVDGNKIFINTGFLLSVDNPDEIAGVVAHETGHIVAKHYSNIHQEINKNNNIILASALLSLGMIAGGSPESATATIMAGYHIGQQNILSYSRAQEEVADKFAVQFLTQANLSPSALLNLLKKFYNQDVVLLNDNSEYFQTHPLSKHRLEYIRAEIEKKNYKKNNSVFNNKFKKAFDLVKAKVFAASQKNENSLLLKYPVSLQTEESFYSRAVFYYLNHNFNKALKEIDEAIQINSINPYFYELKGDVFYNLGKLNLALKNYNKSKSLLSSKHDKTLLELNIANLVILLNDKTLLSKTINTLKKIIQNHPNNILGMKLLSEAYYKNKQYTQSYLTLAEMNLKTDNFKKVKNNLDMAKKYVGDNKRLLLKIRDLEDGLKVEMRNKRK